MKEKSKSLIMKKSSVGHLYFTQIKIISQHKDKDK